MVNGGLSFGSISILGNIKILLTRMSVCVCVRETETESVLTSCFCYAVSTRDKKIK